MTGTEIVQIIAGLVGTMGFGVLFNIRGKRLLAATVGGMLSWTLFVIINRWVGNEALTYFFVSAMITVYAEVMARILKSPTTTFVITSLIPMIPGSSLYYTMVSVLSLNQTEFLTRAVGTLQLAAALALGVVTVTSLSRLIQKIINRCGKQNEKK